MHSLIQWLLANSIKGSILIFVIVLIQLVFKKQIPAKWKYLMWLLVVFRLLMPPVMESSLSFFNLQDKIPHQKMSFISEKETPQTTNLIFQQSTQKSKLDSNETLKKVENIHKFNFTTLELLFITWILVAIALLLIVIYKNHKIYSVIKKQTPLLHPKWLSLLEECKKEMQTYVPIQVVETSYVKTPTLLGFIRPRILMPLRIFSSMDEAEIRLIFLHELNHLKQGDIIINWLFSLVQILHWFNPLVWLAFAKAREAREIACDDNTITFLGNRHSNEYGHTIIKLIDLCCNEKYITGMVGILENKKKLRRRIQMIGNRKPKSKIAIAFAIILLAGLAIMFLPEAKGREPAKINKDEIDFDHGPNKFYINGKIWYSSGNSSPVYHKSFSKYYKGTFECDNESLSEVIKKFQKLIKKVDPKNKVISIEIKGKSQKEKRISLKIKNARLGTIFRKICYASNKGAYSSNGKIIMEDNSSYNNPYYELAYATIPYFNGENITVATALNKLKEKFNKVSNSSFKIKYDIENPEILSKKVSIKAKDFTPDIFLGRITSEIGCFHNYKNNKVVIGKSKNKFQSLLPLKIKSIDLININGIEAAKYLTKVSKELDPEGSGIKFINMSFEAYSKKITFKGKNISLGDIHKKMKEIYGSNNVEFRGGASYPTAIYYGKIPGKKYYTSSELGFLEKIKPFRRKYCTRKIKKLNLQNTALTEAVMLINKKIQDLGAEKRFNVKLATESLGNIILSTNYDNITLPDAIEQICSKNKLYSQLKFEDNKLTLFIRK